MSKEIVKRRKRKADWVGTKGGVVVVTYYTAPSFKHIHGMCGHADVGFVNEHLRPRNASSPLAKKEYDMAYKFWGKRIMDLQRNHRDD